MQDCNVRKERVWEKPETNGRKEKGAKVRKEQDRNKRM